jgi:site-specific recombinase XerD
MPELRLITPTRHRCFDALQDFYLAKRASLAADRTIEFYQRTAGDFVAWLIAQGIAEPEKITGQHVRSYLVHVRERDVSEATVRIYAQGIKAFCRFCTREWGAPAFAIDMPRPERKQMRVPSPDELAALLGACLNIRDRALLLFLADTGARVSEAAALNWEDLDIETGVVRIRRGKGRKARTVMVGIETRRAMLRYRHRVPNEPADPLWGGQQGRLSRDGIRHLFRRLEERTGLKFSPHDLRRFFATASLRSGMNVLHVQSLLGHTSLEMTRRYLSIVEDDLRQAHEQHGPVDHWLQGRK